MPVIIGALVAAIVTALRTYLPGIIGRILLALGIGFAVKEIAIPSLIALVNTYLVALPPILMAYFGALKIDVCISLILSAFAAKATQKAMLAKLDG
jgi:hypothetical protein